MTSGLLNVKYFDLSSKGLIIKGRSVSDWARRVGRTPFYLYDSEVIYKKIAELRSVLPTEVSLHYAIKANPNLELVRFMAQNVDGFDVASAAEMHLAIKAGMNRTKISFAGPGKTDQELEQALLEHILINVESLNEVRRIAEISNRIGTKSPRIALRINPPYEMKSSGMRMGGGAKAFGIDSEQIPAVCQEIRKLNLKIEGVHIFAGSQSLSARVLSETFTSSFDLLNALKENFTQPLQSFNFGGGFGIPYFEGDPELDLVQVGDALRRLVKKFKVDFPNTEMILELGRFLVGEAGIFVCRIIEKKISRGQTFLVMDGGMNGHLAATGNLGQVIKRNFPIFVAAQLSSDFRETVSIVGPLCTPLDSFAQQIEVDCCSSGDLVVVFQSGAYGLTASPIHFLSHPPPLEIFI